MSDIPSWCRVGAKVVCIDDLWLPLKMTVGAPKTPLDLKANLPTAGSVYVVRGIVSHDNGPGVLLAGLDNSHVRVRNGRELAFRPDRFRPLVTIEDDLEAHFSQLLIVSTPQTVEA